MAEKKTAKTATKKAAATKTTAKKTAAKTTTKKTTTKKAASKKLSVTLDTELLEQLEQYIAEYGYSKEDFVRKAIFEKISRDKISSMIDDMIRL